MSVVSAKCPNCGASIQLDNEQTEGFCLYCGSKVVVSEAISLIRIDNSQSLNNYIELGKSALSAGNGKEAFEYANKALEVAPDLSDAWIIKMKSIEYLGTIGDPRISEVMQCGDNAIKFALNSTEKQNEVYSYYLNRALSLILVGISQISDVSGIKETFRVLATVSAFSAGNETLQADSTFVNLIESLISNALLLKIVVPVEVIKNNEDYLELIREISDGYVRYSQCLSDRYAIYGAKLLDSAVAARRENAKLFREGLPEIENSNFDESKINNTSSNGNCYIATAVYGSYEAQEVIVLRRFRDEILSKSLLGRIFINIYYTLSPPFANWLKNAERTNKVTKLMLDKWVNSLNRRFN